MDRKRLVERLLPIAASVIMQLIATRTYAELQRQLRQARLLQQQMEEDHALLVRSVIEIRDRYRPAPKVAPQPWARITAEPYQPYGEEDAVDQEDADSGE